jgi:hypothetical protein
LFFRITFHITGNTKRSNYKGIKSKSLVHDLFDDDPKSSISSTLSPMDAVTSITVCHICYESFPNQTDLKPHMIQNHTNIKTKKGNLIFFFFFLHMYKYLHHILQNYAVYYKKYNNKNIFFIDDYLGKYHLGKNEFKCPTCYKKIMVQHIVWFVKHMR